MTVAYGPTPENYQLATEKAKEKADGVYSFRGVAYRIRDHRITHYAHSGRVLERFGHFDTQVGTYEGHLDAAKRALKSLDK